MDKPPPRTPAAADGRLGVDWQAALAEHGGWLRTVLAARLGDRHAVDDVMQEVSLAAVAQKAPLADPTKVAPWLYRLAVTQALMYRRKLGRQRKLVDRFVERTQPGEADPQAADPLDWLLADERNRMIRRAMQCLPRRDAEILLLKYAENWSYHQIAHRLGMSHSAVEARLHRARGKLREQLASAGVTASLSA